MLSESLRSNELPSEAQLKRLNKYKCCSICFLVTGIFLVITSAVTPKTMDSLILFGAKKSSQLTQENEADWKDIPGSNDIGIYWNQYFYNCTNAEDVVYKNHKPEYREYGPYVYREWDNYTDLVYQDLDNNIGKESLPAVYNQFGQGTWFESDVTGNIDEKMYLTNQALFGVWYQQNAAKAADQQWRVYLTLLYSAVQDGLGRQVIENACWTAMYGSNFKTQAKINRNFLAQNPVSDETADLLYNDPFYGLSNFENYARWNNLIYLDENADVLKKQEQAVWMWELRTYFGLTFAQVQEMQTNWNLYYADALNEIYTTSLSVDPWNDQTGIAYWQWASGYMTYRATPPEPSVAQSSDTVTGYVEFSYWLSSYCNPETGAGAMSQENWEIFKDIKMYNDPSDPYSNLEGLWAMNDPETGGDPLGSSLFNLTSLKEMVNLGLNTDNIITDKDLVFDYDFQLSQNWTDLALTLNLTDPSQEDDTAVKRCYLLWLWMQSAWDLTFARLPEPNGSFQIGVIGTLGATAYSEVMNTMNLEMPMLTIATQMEQDYINSGQDCSTFVTSEFGIDATALCTTSTNFTFADPFQTAVAFTSSYLYQDAYASWYFDEFAEKTGLDKSQAQEYFYGEDNAFSIYYQKLQEDIKAHYDDGTDVCSGQQIPTLTVCAFSNFTNNQWLEGTVLKNPLPGQEVTSNGYVKNYGDYATGWITPEYSFWKAQNEEPDLAEDAFREAIDQSYYAFNASGLFNGKKFQDQLMYPDTQINQEWFPDFQQYLRSVTVNFGLSALITVRSPREMIEGYTDELVATLNETPIYMGGDNTTSAFLAMNKPPTHPDNNTVAFFTGVDDYTYTRTYGQWLGSENIMMKGKEYKSISVIEDYTYSPWADPVLLDGTDGMQFNPDQQKDEPLKAFVNDLSRNCYFDYSHTDDRYPGLDNYIFEIQYALMQNKTANPANENYDVRITGSTNMTTTLNAWGFAAKGHYYDMSELAADSQPIILNSTMQQIEPVKDEDDTLLGVERLSGVCLVAKERIFLNMAIYGDDLFQNFTPEIPEDFGYFFPLSFVKRESEWTQDQVDAVFSPLVLGEKLKWVFFSLILFFGLGFLGLTVLYGLKYYRLRNDLYPHGKQVVEAREEAMNLNTPSLSSKDNKKGLGLLGDTDSDEDRKEYGGADKDSMGSFAENPPSVTQNERVFNLHGQGKPIAELSEYSKSDSRALTSRDLNSGKVAKSGSGGGYEY